MGLLKKYRMALIQMEDEPVTLPLEESKKGDSLLVREFDEKLNVAEDKFRFKSTVDWKSIYPPLERVEREQIRKEYLKKKMDSTMAFRSLCSQEKYSPLRPEYRSRERCKEINPAMRYATKNTSVTLQVLPRIKNNVKSNSLNRSIISPESSEKKEDEGLTNSNEGHNSSIDYLENLNTARRSRLKPP